MVQSQIWVKNMESKKDIRKRVLEMRNQMTIEEWDDKSHNIFQKVVTHPFFLHADTIYCYIDFRREVGTRRIIEHAWKLQKKVAVPKIHGENMDFYYIRQYSDLRKGYFGIMEPDILQPAKDLAPLVIMPGAVYDKKRNRIGYGKGFYDKFLAKHSGCRTMALGFELQVLDKIPTNHYDVCPQILITEENIYDK